MDPCMTIRVRGDGYEGFVVVDSIVGDTSAGGVRIVPDLELEEIGALAREMTYKYALFRLPRGGAKAGVRLAPQLDREARLQALEDFGRKLGPVLRTGTYNPGMDMNCGPEELRAIYRGAGIQLGKVTDTSYFTALGVHQALEACAGVLGREAAVTLVIEGFGSVARHLAARLDARYRIVGVATVAGAVLHSAGFDAHRLAAQRDERGDAFVTALEGEKVDAATLRAAAADIFVPAARTGALTLEAAPRLGVRAVVPIANAPYAAGVVEVLHERGIVCLPGYVVNVGGVLASSLFDQGVPVAAIETLFAGRYRSIVKELLEAAGRRGVPATVLAAELAAQEFPARNRHRYRSLPRRLYERFLRRRLPRWWRGRLALRRCVRALDALRAAISSPGVPA